MKLYRLLKRGMNRLQELITILTVALSFIVIIGTFAFIIYFLYFDFDVVRVIAGVVSLYVFIHLNKSLTGR